jgi:hypothetical protein
MTDNQKLLLGAAGVGLLLYAIKQRKAFDALDDTVTLLPPPPDLDKPDVSTVPDKPPVMVAGGAQGPTGPGGDISYEIPTPPGKRAPGQDTNLWWFPMESPKDLGYGADEDKWWWQRGEGYIPDSIPFFGTRAGAQETIEEIVEAGARGAGQGITGRDPDDDTPLIPKWVWPVSIGALVLGTLLILRTARKGA